MTGFAKRAAGAVAMCLLLAAGMGCDQSVDQASPETANLTAAGGDIAKEDPYARMHTVQVEFMDYVNKAIANGASETTLKGYLTAGQFNNFYTAVGMSTSQFNSLNTRYYSAVAELDAKYDNLQADYSNQRTTMTTSEAARLIQSAKSYGSGDPLELPPCQRPNTLGQRTPCQPTAYMCAALCGLTIEVLPAALLCGVYCYCQHCSATSCA